MDQKKIGAFLKTLRTQQGMTQEDLAQRFGVSNRSVSRWETGSNMPDLGTIFALAEFYNVEIKELINGERKTENTDMRDKEELNMISSYALYDKLRLIEKLRIFNIAGVLFLMMGLVLELSEDAAIWVGRDYLYSFLEGLSQGVAMGVLLLGIIYLTKLLVESKKKKSELASHSLR